jgi:uncharacterized protein
MLILLPPSEGKAEGTGSPLKLPTLVFGRELVNERSSVLDALQRVCKGPKGKALEALGLSASMAPLVERNLLLQSAPASPAIEIYTGVLYEALNWSALTAKARKRGEESVLISSALFGVVRPQDRIPAYRLSMDVSLPKLGGLAAFWRPALAQAMERASTGLVIDCRSSTYAASWTPPAQLHYPVKVMTEKAGKRSIVSHMAKQSRGHLARLLLSSGRVPKTIDDVAEIAAQEFDVEIDDATEKKSGVLTLIVAG